MTLVDIGERFAPNASQERRHKEWVDRMLVAAAESGRTQSDIDAMREAAACPARELWMSPREAFAMKVVGDLDDLLATYTEADVWDMMRTSAGLSHAETMFATAELMGVRPSSVSRYSPRQESQTALYRFFDETGALLYLGITSDPESRFGAHKTRAEWWPYAARVEIEWLESRPAAHAAEVAAIRKESPIFNLQSSQAVPGIAAAYLAAGRP